MADWRHIAAIVCSRSTVEFGFGILPQTGQWCLCLSLPVSHVGSVQTTEIIKRHWLLLLWFSALACLSVLAGQCCMLWSFCCLGGAMAKKSWKHNTNLIAKAGYPLLFYDALRTSNRPTNCSNRWSEFCIKVVLRDNCEEAFCSFTTVDCASSAVCLCSSLLRAMPWIKVNNPVTDVCKRSLREDSSTTWVRFSALVMPLLHVTHCSLWLVRQRSHQFSNTVGGLRSFVCQPRTSSATTEKPLPCSPALAASIATFRANKLVWAVISVITETICTIFCVFFIHFINSILPTTERYS